MILVLSGTSDGRNIIELLSKSGHSVIASTATEYGGILVEPNEKVEVISKRLNQSEMESLIVEKGVVCIVDATHPYADKVSTNAMAASKSTKIQYVRYERKSDVHDKVNYFPDYDSSIVYLKETKGNILLTIGSNNLEVFTSSLDINRLYVRVLPTHSVIKKCEDLGLLPKQIIAAQGPFTKKFNKAMYGNYDIDHIVTKDSGDIGGTKEKVQGAIDAGVNVVLIQRPKIEYVNLYNSIDEVINAVDKLLRI